MQIDPRHLQILAAIVDAGGLTEGAESLGKSQPSVSRTLAALEARLGTRLFEKGKRPLRPTELCRILAAEGRVIAQASKQAAQAVAGYSGGRLGSVRIGGTPIFMDGAISNMIAGFQAEFSDVRIDQSYGYADELIDRLVQGAIDLAICPLTPAMVPEGCDFDVFLPGRNVIVCGQGHPLARKPSLRLTDIAPFPWIAPPTGSPLYDDLKKVLAAIGIEDVRVSFSGGSLTSIMNILAGSNAITVLPHSVVFMQRHQKTIRALPIRIEHPDRQLGLLSHEKAEKNPTVTRLRRHLKAQFGGLSHSIREHERNALWRA